MNWEREAPDWLLSAAEDPQACRDVWAANPRLPQLLPVGRTFDVVTVKYRVGVEVLSLLAALSAPKFPTQVNYGSMRVAFLVPVGSGEALRDRLGEGPGAPGDYRYLGEGSFVVIAGPAALAGTRYSWIYPPTDDFDETRDAMGDFAEQLAVADRTVASAAWFGGSLDAGDSDG